MRIRYKKVDGLLTAVAKVYSKEEHKIDKSRIDPDALSAITRLKDKGFEAYIVGGALRDILLGRVPKDFDIATDASPRQVNKLFRQARVIGKRFRLVQLVYQDKIIEVSTFRNVSEEGLPSNNVYGSIETDAKRRDFTINSLYYDPVEDILLDYNNSFRDFKKKRIVSVLPLSETFIEDPVRMIRAVKFSVTTGFRLDLPLKLAIKRDASRLEGISASRLTEEVCKILGSGCSAKIIKMLDDCDLLIRIMPCLCVYTKQTALFESLEKLDAKINASSSRGGNGPEVQKWEYFYYLAQPLIINSEQPMTDEEHFDDIFRQMKVLFAPITPPNSELENACAHYMKDSGFELPKARRVLLRNPKKGALSKRRRKRSKANKKLPEALSFV